MELRFISWWETWLQRVEEYYKIQNIKLYQAQEVMTAH